MKMNGVIISFETKTTLSNSVLQAVELLKSSIFSSLWGVLEGYHRFGCCAEFLRSRPIVYSSVERQCRLTYHLGKDMECRGLCRMWRNYVYKRNHGMYKRQLSSYSPHFFFRGFFSFLPGSKTHLHLLHPSISLSLKVILCQSLPLDQTHQKNGPTPVRIYLPPVGDRYRKGSSYQWYRRHECRCHSQGQDHLCSRVWPSQREQ